MSIKSSALRDMILLSSAIHQRSREIRPNRIQNDAEHEKADAAVSVVFVRLTTNANAGGLAFVASMLQYFVRNEEEKVRKSHEK